MIDEQSSVSGHDYASDRSAIGAGCTLSRYGTPSNWLTTKCGPTLARLCGDRNGFKISWQWLGPYLVVSITGWAVGVQLQPGSPLFLCRTVRT